VNRQNQHALYHVAGLDFYIKDLKIKIISKLPHGFAISLKKTNINFPLYAETRKIAERLSTFKE
jgi:hypothetical protein